MYKSKRSLKVYVIFHLIMSVLTFRNVRIAIWTCPYSILIVSVLQV